MNIFARFPALSFFLLACVISWLALLPIVGVDGFLGQAVIEDEVFPLLFLAMCAGPIGATVFLNLICDGMRGLRSIFVKLIIWRVSIGYYAFALLSAPALMLASFVLLHQFFGFPLPEIFQSDQKTSLILIGLMAGLAAGLCEEIGWSGFMVSKLRASHSILSTGLLVGVGWGIWHLPLFMDADPDGVLPFLPFLLAKLLTHLPAFRVLLVWLYHRTKSLLLVILMHMSLTATTLIFGQGILTGVNISVLNITFSLLIIALIFLVNALTGGEITRKTNPTIDGERRT